MGASAHALSVLEFDTAIGLIETHAVSEGGREGVRTLRPHSDRASAEAELNSVEALRQAFSGEDPWSIHPFPRLDGTLNRLQLADAVLTNTELLACADVMRAGRANRRVRKRLPEILEEATDDLLSVLTSALWGDRDLTQKIERTVADDGSVADGASPELKRIRRTLVSRRGRLVSRLEEFASGLPTRFQVADASVTLRNGRYCVPVRREGRVQVGGLVHDASGSRQTLFIEPSWAIDAMNEIRELEFKEEREVLRILSELSAALRAHFPELKTSYEALVTLDTLSARALFADRLGGTAPTFTDSSSEICIRQARHPILAVELPEVVPFDLDLSPDERVLLLSGPNAGGKTVLLKTLGLTSALAQSGIVPPVGPGTRIPFFRTFFAVIGDEQSIDASLSTFGAQARSLANILRSAGPDDLVLFDEIGNATDPTEGAALAAAALKQLAGQARLVVATTHLGDLKKFGEEEGATVSASLAFDSGRFEPTFQLVLGRPGRSYSLAIASRFGVPRKVLEDARSRLKIDHVTLDKILSELEEEREGLAQARAALGSLRTDLDRQADAVAVRSDEIARREAELQRQRRDLSTETAKAHRETLRQGRTLVEDAIDELRSRAEAAIGNAEALKKAERRARSRVEKAFRESAGMPDQRTGVSRTKRKGAERIPVPGDRVSWGASKNLGQLREIRGEHGIVELGGLRLTVPVSDLICAEPESASSTGNRRRVSSRTRPPVGEAHDIAARTEVDLRGLRVHEVDTALLQVVDAAVVSGLPWLRVIHGKGTGALRNRVHELLSSDPRIGELKRARLEDGGTGVTVVEFQ